MSQIKSPLILLSLIDAVKDLNHASDWKPFRPGVSAHWLYDEGNGGAAAVILRYDPGARVAVHEHLGYEHVLVLEGDQFDELGSYPAGSLVINPPGTRHSPGSKGGCLALLIYERAVRFIESE